MARSRGRPKLSAHRRQAGDRAPVALSRDPSPPGRCGRLRRLRSVSSRARSSIAGPDRPAPPVSAHPGVGHLRGLAFSRRAKPDHRAGFRPLPIPVDHPSAGRASCREQIRRRFRARPAGLRLIRTRDAQSQFLPSVSLPVRRSLGSVAGWSCPARGVSSR